MEQVYYEIEGSIRCVKEYCKEQRLFQTHPEKQLFEGLLDSILAHYEMVDPEFNDDIQDMIEY